MTFQVLDVLTGLEEVCRCCVDNIGNEKPGDSGLIYGKNTSKYGMVTLIIAEHWTATQAGRLANRQAGGRTGRLTDMLLDVF